MKRGYVDRPDCRVYYEVSGQGPVLVFAHGLGGNHMSWWQQVPHFRDRYTCVTFSHRGFSPSSAPAGGPDPQAYGGDLAALVDHLGAPDVRIVAQSMGGWGALDYALANPGRVRALVLASTGGSAAWPAFPFPEPDKIARWRSESEAASAGLFARGIHPAGGDDILDQRRRLGGDDFIDRRAAHDLEQHRLAVALRIADVADETREARVEHQDAEGHGRSLR